MIIDQQLYNKHLDQASHHLEQAELWLDVFEKEAYLFVDYHIKMSRQQIIMAKVYIGKGGSQ